MTRKTARSSRKSGLPPGTLLHVGKERTEKVRITVIDYDKDNLEEREIESIAECEGYKTKPSVTWINVDGVHDASVVEQLGACYGLHPLLMEDILNTTQRPKAEESEDRVFIVLKMLYVRGQDKKIDAEQVSLVLGPNYVLTFQEQRGDVFETIRERLRSAGGRVRRRGADYLAYSIIDAIVDNYFLILEGIGDTVEELEEEVVDDPERRTLSKIYALKRELISLRRAVWPLREVVSVLERSESPLFDQSTFVYLRDVYDHTIQVIDTIEVNREVVSGMVDVYLSSISNRMNDVMKVLTIIATIFIPLTFVAGIYGMNFEYMPELSWPPAYFVVWGVMIAIATTMVVYFRKKHWF